MKNHLKDIHIFINFLIGLVWFVNGALCKIFNLVPRHQQIVAEVLSENYAEVLTYTIGGLEVILGVLIWFRWQPKILAIIQIIGVLSMNIIEMTFVKELLLWGEFNLIFALIFILIVATNEFYIANKINR